MIDKIFLQILNMSVTGGVVIAFVLLARLALHKAPKVFSYALWLVVLFRLICPFSFESAWSLLPAQANPISQDTVYGQITGVDTGTAEIYSAVNAIFLPAAPYASANSLQIWMFIGSIIWLAGITAMLIYSLATLYRLKKNLHNSIFYKNNIFLSDKIDTAFVMGVFHPKIYLPVNLSDIEREYILLHEQSHIRRLDHVVKLASFLVLCIHWFNPLVWAAFFLSGKDMEMSCDECVIKHLGNEVKKDYSSSLLTLATGRRMIGGAPLAFGEGDTKGRIKNVLNYKKPAFWAAAVAVIAVTGLGIGLMANPKDKADNYWSSSAKDVFNRYVLALAASDITGMRQLMPALNPPIQDIIEGWKQIKIGDITLLNEEVRENKAAFEISVTVKEAPDGLGMWTPGMATHYLYAERCDNGWYVESYGAGGRSQSDLERWWSQPNLIEPTTTMTPTDDEFTAAVMTEYENGGDKAHVKITDNTEINKLRSLLLLGELTDRESINDAPNQESYIHIVFEDESESVDCYMYQDDNNYYIERPYNGIWEISADTHSTIMSMMNAGTKNKEVSQEDAIEADTLEQEFIRQY